MASLEGRCALVTGAGSGMGRSHALLLAERGADVIVHDVNGEGAEGTAEDVRRRGRKAHIVVRDIRETAAWRDDVAGAEAAFAPIDILVNNAGISGRGLKFEEIDEDSFDALMAVHVKGAFFTTQQVAESMKSRCRGRIVNISSTYGIAGAGQASHYAGAKAALLGFTKGWARELAPYNITVNAVAPGFILTPMTERVLKAPGRLEKRVSAIPLGRHGEAMDISYAVGWLVSDEAAFVTGQVLSPNGGEYIT